MLRDCSFKLSFEKMLRDCSIELRFKKPYHYYWHYTVLPVLAMQWGTTAAPLVFSSYVGSETGCH